jgi:FkbM family methyltransferase
MNRWMIKAKHSFSMFRHFRSPALTFLVRLGFLKVDYCSYRLRKNGYSYGLLGRPLGGDHRIIREVLIDETYAPILPILPNKPLRALDIGAHIGSFMIWLSAHKTVGEAYCFEPEPDSFNLCRFNLAQQANVQVIRTALGGKTRRSAIFIDPAAHGRSTIIEGMGRPANTQAADTMILSLADWMADRPNTWDLLKMDCEGAEWEILRACPEAFSRFSVIVAEIHHDPVEHRTSADFASAIQELGFKIVPNNRLFLAVKKST